MPGFGLFGITGSLALILSLTLTTLQPYGVIEVESKQIDVTSNEGYIDKNQAVQIIQVKEKTVIVKKILKEESYDIY